MSIANHSVVGRILAQVRQAARPRELGRPERFAAAAQALELRCSACLHRPPFSSALHFWAHALLDFLEQRGRPDLFDAMATHGLCRRLEGEALEQALAGLADARWPGAADRLRGPFRTGWSMIEQEVMRSWLGERDDEWLAVFWVQPAWLELARPHDPRAEEDEEEADAGAWAGRPSPSPGVGDSGAPR